MSSPAMERAMGRRPSTPSDPAEQPGTIASREGSQAAQPFDRVTDTLATPINAHAWQREVHGHYVEPHWCSERLFAEEDFSPGIWDPCCGFGRIPDSAVKAGLYGIGTDIVDRGYRDFAGALDFIRTDRPRAPNIVCNPPFNIAGTFAAKALSFEGTQKVAMIFPTARLNAAHWLRGTPLARVWLMSPRPGMPPRAGHTITAGEKPGGGKMDFCWLVWSKGHGGPAELRWLRRDA